MYNLLRHSSFWFGQILPESWLEEFNILSTSQFIQTEYFWYNILEIVIFFTFSRYSVVSWNFLSNTFLVIYCFFFYNSTNKCWHDYIHNFKELISLFTTLTLYINFTPWFLWIFNTQLIFQITELFKSAWIRHASLWVPRIFTLFGHSVVLFPLFVFF